MKCIHGDQRFMNEFNMTGGTKMNVASRQQQTLLCMPPHQAAACNSMGCHWNKKQNTHITVKSKNKKSSPSRDVTERH